MKQRAILVALFGALVPACTDPGCIRNGECGAGYRCEQAACVADPVDGGSRADAKTDADDAGRE